MPKKLSDSLILYDVEELSRVLDIQEKTIRQLLRDGKLKGRKMARKWYVTEQELKAYFLGQEEPAEALEQQAQPAERL